MAIEDLLGRVPKEWEQITLGEACKRDGGDIQTGPFGSQLHAADYVSTGIPSIMPQNIGDNRVVEKGIARITREDAERLSRYLVRKGDIVYSRRGDVEKRALIREREDGWLCGTGCLRVRFGSDWVNPMYASYYLGHPSVREWVVRHAHGATMANLNTSILSALPFAVPPPHIQSTIANILGSLDDKIELNRKVSETLEAIVRTIFKSWFVDFDPVRAKAIGESSASICRRLGLTTDLIDFFPRSFHDSELDQIPEGWIVRPLGSLTEIGIGKTPPRKEPEWFSEDGRHTRWVSIRDMGVADVFLRNTTELLTHEAVRRFNVKVVSDYTVLLSFKLTIGRVAITDGEMTTNEAIAHFNLPNDSLITTEYLYSYLKGFDYSNLGSTSSIAEAVNSQMIRDLPIVTPPRELVNAFTMRVRGLFEKLRLNARETDTLVNLRDVLLPELLSGKVGAPIPDRPSAG